MMTAIEIPSWGGSELLTFDNGSINLLPSWSRSGREVLFTSYIRHNPNLYSISSAGGGTPKLLSGERGLNRAAGNAGGDTDDDGIGLEGIRDAYETGRGRVRVRARAHTEPLTQGKEGTYDGSHYSRAVNARVLAGSNWLGLKDREAFVTRGVKLIPMFTGFLALAALLERFPDLRLAVPDDEVEWKDGSAIWGLAHLPVALQQALALVRQQQHRAAAFGQAAQRGDHAGVQGPRR